MPHLRFVLRFVLWFILRTPVHPQPMTVLKRHLCLQLARLHHPVQRPLGLRLRQSRALLVVPAPDLKVALSPGLAHRHNLIEDGLSLLVGERHHQSLSGMLYLAFSSGQSMPSPQLSIKKRRTIPRPSPCGYFSSSQ